MQFFLDTANLESIKKYAEWGVVDGVTTNPTLIAKEGADHETRIREICKIVDGPVSAEVLATTAEGMFEEAQRITKWHENVYVKLPTTVDGMTALKMCKKEKIKVNMTLVFTCGQAILCAKNGADLISPFIGRLDDVGVSGIGLIADLMKIWSHYNFRSKILVASVRSIDHIVESAKLGAPIATVPADILEQLIHHELTDKGLAKFLQDAKAERTK